MKFGAERWAYRTRLSVVCLLIINGLGPAAAKNDGGGAALPADAPLAHDATSKHNKQGEPASVPTTRAATTPSNTLPSQPAVSMSPTRSSDAPVIVASRVTSSSEQINPTPAARPATGVDKSMSRTGLSAPKTTGRGGTTRTSDSTQATHEQQHTSESIEPTAAGDKDHKPSTSTGKSSSSNKDSERTGEGLAPSQSDLTHSATQAAAATSTGTAAGGLTRATDRSFSSRREARIPPASDNIDFTSAHLRPSPSSGLTNTPSATLLPTLPATVTPEMTPAIPEQHTVINTSPVASPISSDVIMTSSSTVSVTSQDTNVLDVNPTHTSMTTVSTEVLDSTTPKQNVISTLPEDGTKLTESPLAVTTVAATNPPAGNTLPDVSDNPAVPKTGDAILTPVIEDITSTTTVGNNIPSGEKSTTTTTPTTLNVPLENATTTISNALVINEHETTPESMQTSLSSTSSAMTTAADVTTRTTLGNDVPLDVASTTTTTPNVTDVVLPTAPSMPTKKPPENVDTTLQPTTLKPPVTTIVQQAPPRTTPPTTKTPVVTKFTKDPNLDQAFSMLSGIIGRFTPPPATVPPPPPVFITLLLRMTPTDFCTHSPTLKATLQELLDGKTGTIAEHEQIYFFDNPCRLESVGGDTNGPNNKKIRREAVAAPAVMPESERRVRRTPETSVSLYVIDHKGKYDLKTTATLALLMRESTYWIQEAGLQNVFVKLDTRGLKPTDTTKTSTHDSTLSPGHLAAIIVMIVLVIGVVAGFAFVFSRHRFGVKKMRYAYDENASRPSVDIHSIAESIQLSNVTVPGPDKPVDLFGFLNEAYMERQISMEKSFTSNSLSLNGLSNIVDEDETIEEEFLMIPNYMPKLSDIPPGAENKNRYANVIPVPATRVELTLKDGDELSQYINANFVRGVNGGRTYIATQAPLGDTRLDFWRMIWEQQVNVIIMLTDLEEQGVRRLIRMPKLWAWDGTWAVSSSWIPQQESKCAEYWPNTAYEDTYRIYGDYSVFLQSRDVTQDWIISKLRLLNTKLNLSQDVYHAWLTAWPEHGVPPTPGLVIRFLQKLRPAMVVSHGPTVVHCSPGTGRTGTLMAIDVCIGQYERTGRADILHCVHSLRQDRAGAVQTKQQYNFIYKTIHECAMLLSNPSVASVPVGDSVASTRSNSTESLDKT